MMNAFSRFTVTCLGLIFIWSCSGKSAGTDVSSDPVVSDPVKAEVDVAIDSEESDSIAMLYGSLVGNDFSLRFVHSEDFFKDVDRKEFLRGMRVALDKDNRSASYTEGVRVAIDILKEMDHLGNHNVALDPRRVFAAIERRLRADTITESETVEAARAYNLLLQRVYAADNQ